MAGAQIGALRVALGLDSAQFSAGLKSANTGLSKFAKSAAIGFAAVAAAATAAGAALAVAVKGSIDRADDLSKTAQRIGVTTEALSRLEWAAKLSDVSLQQLSTGMQRLSRNMLEVSQGKGAQAATAFQALGISVTDAAGNLRSSDEVFADIAERFANMPDGAEKTALAMQLLGRAGAEMIPLLNSGRNGLAEMADESDRLGNTLSTRTGKAAEAFNDSITRLQAGLQGMVNRIAEAALPTLNNLIGTLTSPDFMQAMQAFAIAAIQIAEGIAQVFIGAHKAFKDFLDFIQAPDRAVAGTGQPFWDQLTPEARNQLRLDTQLSGVRKQPDFYAAFGLNADGTIRIQETTTVAETLATTLETIGTSGGSASEGIRNFASEVNASVPQMTEMQQIGEDLASSLAGGFTDIFSGMIDGTKSVTQGFADMFKNIGQQFLQSGLQRMFSGLFGGILGGGGLGGGWGIPGGFGRPGIFGIPGFADGTNFAPGGLAVVGERGPELVNLPRGSQVIPSEAVGGPTVNINITGSKQDAAAIAREVGRVLPDVMERYQRNPLRRS